MQIHPKLMEGLTLLEPGEKIVIPITVQTIDKVKSPINKLLDRKNQQQQANA